MIGDSAPGSASGWRPPPGAPVIRSGRVRGADPGRELRRSPRDLDGDGCPDEMYGDRKKGRCPRRPPL